MPAANRPQLSFIHSYGPPSWTNDVPSSDIVSAYGRRKKTASTRSQVNVCAPYPDTWPRVSRPTSAHTVKKSMSKRRRLLWSLAFSSTAMAVVCSTSNGSDEDIRPSQ